MAAKSRFDISTLPEFHKLARANPQNPPLDALGAITVFGRAIHWAAILDVIWPDFENQNYLTLEAAYLTVNDPDDQELPEAFHKYLAKMITMFWDLQLRTHHPDWKWNISIDDDPEITLEVQILARGHTT
ncbi:MAG TPA: hypothetical protein VIU38_06225 [Anaerolineales bacterium]